MYKTRSIGYQGEAHKALIMSSEVTVYTRDPNQEHGWRLHYSTVQYDLLEKVPCDCEPGTSIEVRKIHSANP